MNKSQQMRWSRDGADLLHVRCAVYNGTFGVGFGDRFDRIADADPAFANTPGRDTDTDTDSSIPRQGYSCKGTASNTKQGSSPGNRNRDRNRSRSQEKRRRSQLWRGLGISRIADRSADRSAPLAKLRPTPKWPPANAYPPLKWPPANAYPPPKWPPPLPRPPPSFALAATGDCATPMASVAAVARYRSRCILLPPMDVQHPRYPMVVGGRCWHQLPSARGPKQGRYQPIEIFGLR
jgi:hypothetical protein